MRKRLSLLALVCLALVFGLFTPAHAENGYTVEFTRDGLEYVLPGDTSVAMSEILSTLGLTGEIDTVEVSNPGLFSASNATGEWVVTAHQAFSTTEWMKVTINGVVYEITVTDDQSVTYIHRSWNAENGEVEETVKTTTAKEVTASTSAVTWGTTGETWYVVNSNVTISGRVTVNGTVNLILCDGYTLTASKGITVTGSNVLNIYSQSDDSENTGTLKAQNNTSNSSYYGAGIGGFNGTKAACGTVNIYGGKVIAQGSYAAGIGGGQYGSGGTIGIYGGTITAHGGNGGAGIGSGVTNNKSNSNTDSKIVIMGKANVTAYGDKSGGAGIGSGQGWDSSSGGKYDITIGGSVDVTATGSGSSAHGGAGIGGGSYSRGGTITISGGTVTATGANGGAGIGSGKSGKNATTITIKGGTVTATGSRYGTTSNYAAAIGLGAANNGSGIINLNGGIITTGDITTEKNNIGVGNSSANYPVNININLQKYKDRIYNAGNYYGKVNIDSGHPLLNMDTNKQVDADKMPEGPSKLKLYSGPTTYQITSYSDEFGNSVTPRADGSYDTNPHAGDEIDIVVTPGAGYRYKENSLTVKDADNNLVEVVNQRFEMPARNVTLSATFEKIPITYIAPNGTTVSNFTEYTPITSSLTEWTGGASTPKVFAVFGEVTISQRVTISDNVTLVLTDGAKLIPYFGINVSSGQVLNICGYSTEETEMGALSIANTNPMNPGIGGIDSCGSINICGGKISVIGGNNCAGIGGCNNKSGGTITISGGIVMATGGAGGAGIGGGSNGGGGTITISGGHVVAVGKVYTLNNDAGAGIGGGSNGGGGTITISGGNIEATGGEGAVGIGGGSGKTDTGSLTVDLSSDDDSLKASSYTALTVEGNNVLTDGEGASYTGTLNADALTAIKDKTLVKGYTISVNVSGDGGTVTPSAGVAPKNRRVTLNVSPAEGYELQTLSYQVEGSSVSVDIAKGDDGKYSFEMPQGNVTVTATFAQHVHHFTYSANGATITAACTDGCGITAGLTLTISAPTDLTYNGQNKAATLSTGYNTTAFPGTYTIVYTKNGGASVATPTDVGEYTAGVTVGEGNGAATASVEYAIAPATLTNVSVAQNGKLTYTGEALTPQVTTAATAVNDQTVTFTYSKTQDGTYGEMPTVTDVTDGGNFYYKASAPNHNDAAGSFTVTVDKASQTAPAAPEKASATINSITLTEITNGEYKMDDGEWQPSPTFTGLAMNTEYTFYQRIAEDANHNASDSSSPAAISTNDHVHNWSYQASGATITATCGNTDGGHGTQLTATMTINAPTLTTYGETGKDANATITGSIDGVTNPDIVYKKDSETLDAAPTNAGTYTASITLGEGEGAKTASVEYEIARRALTIDIATATDRTYVKDNTAVTISGVTFKDSSEQAVALTPGEEGDYTVTGAMSDANAGDGKTVNVSVTLKNANYSLATSTTTTTVNISKADAQTIANVTDTLLYTATSVSETVDGKMPADAGTLTYTAGTASSTGSVTVSGFAVNESGTVTATLSGGAANDTVKLPVTIGSTNYADSTVNVVITLTPKEDAGVSISGAPASAKTYGDADFTLTGRVTNAGTGTGTWTWSTSDEMVFQITPNGATATVKILKAGSATVTAKYESDTTLDTETTAAITVNTKALTIAAKNQSIYVDDTVPTLSGADFYTVSGLVGEDALTTAPTLVYQKNGKAATPDNRTAGTYDIVPSGASAGDNYAITYANGTLTISEKPAATVTKAPTGKTLTYTGSAQELAIKGEATGGTMQYALGTATGATGAYTESIPSAANAGTYYVWYKVKGDTDHNDTAPEKVTTVINPVAVTLTAHSGTATYDGTAKSVTGFTVSVAGLHFTDAVRASGSGTDAGEYAVTFSGVTLNTTKDTTGNYVVTSTVNGKLTINPAGVTLTANSGAATYDGTAKSVTGFRSSVAGLRFADTVRASGSGTNAGEYPVTFSGVTLNTTKDTTGNYVVTATADGKLTINPAGVTLTANSGAATYDGTAKSVTGFSSSVAGLRFADTVSASGSGTDAGEYAVTFSGVTLNTTKDTTGNYVVTRTVNGKLTINPAAVTLTANSRSTDVYDGTAKSVTGFTVSVPGLRFADTVRASGSGTDAGEYAVTFSGVKLNTTKDTTGNYVVTRTVNGKLTINPAPSSVALAPQGMTLIYNGSAQELVTEGEAANGTMQYALGTDARTAPTEGWSTSVPAKTDGGTYYVWYKAVGWKNYSDTQPACVTAVISNSSYAVIYHANGGTGAPETQIKRYNKPLTLSIQEPTRADSAENYVTTLDPNGGTLEGPGTLYSSRTTVYSFRNWNTSPRGLGDVHVGGEEYTDNATLYLYAQWDAESSGGRIVLPEPTREGYAFSGWNTDSSAESGVKGEITPDGSHTYYAIWKANAALPEADFVLPAALVTIEESAFEGIPAARVDIPDGCESIGPRAFADCAKLTALVIPASVQSIDDTALEGSAGAIVYGASGSEAERFAKDNSIPFVPMNNN